MDVYGEEVIPQSIKRFSKSDTLGENKNTRGDLVRSYSIKKEVFFSDILESVALGVFDVSTRITIYFSLFSSENSEKYPLPFIDRYCRVFS